MVRKAVLKRMKLYNKAVGYTMILRNISAKKAKLKVSSEPLSRCFVFSETRRGVDHWSSMNKQVEREIDRLRWEN